MYYHLRIRNQRQMCFLLQILDHSNAKDNEREKNKIDWHDYKRIQEDLVRNGPGEQGLGYNSDISEQRLKDKLFRENGFNALVSDQISLNRSLNDIRHPG